MVRKKKQTSRPRRSRRRREEQLELELTPANDTVVRPMPDFRATSRAPAMSETQTKRLRNGVLVQQMLK